MRQFVDTSGLRYDAIRTFYVAKDGNDGNDGQSRGRAFLTIGAAITAAVALSPSAGNAVAILVEDVGTYTENLTVPDYVLVYAGSAAISGNHTIGDGALLRAGSLVASSGTMVSKTSGSLSAKVEALIMIGTGSAAGLLCTSGTLRFDVGTILTENGWGIGSTSTGDLRGLVNEIQVTGSGYGIGLAAAGTMDITGNTLQCTTASGTAIFVSSGGEVCANLAKVDANGGTALNVGASSTLNLQTGCLVGSKTIVGTVRIESPSSGYDAIERNGFIQDAGAAVDDGGNALTISVDDGTRTLTLAPATSTFTYYSRNMPVTISGSDTAVWTDVEGVHFFYYPAYSTTLTVTQTFQDSFIDGPDNLVAALYWDATNNATILSGALYELHGMSMPGMTHYHLHNVIGAQWYSGLAINTISTDQSGASNAHAQFGVDSGVIADEDQRFSVPAVGSTTGLPVLYFDGASANIREISQAGYSVITDVTAGIGATGRIVYNQFTGGSWQLTVVDNGKYTLCHVFAIGVGGGLAYAIMGQNQYANVSEAREGAETELASIGGLFDLQERRPIATVIFQTSNGYTNAVLARTVSTGTGDDWVDFRSAGALLVGGGGGGVGDHNALAGRSVAGTHPTLQAPASSDQIIKLADAAGTYALSITDSADAEVAYINSDGGALLNSLTVSSSSSLQSTSISSLVVASAASVVGKLSTSEVESSSGDLVLDAPSGSDISLRINGSEIAALSSSGLTFTTGGISFGDEFMSEYDEGTFTPAIAGLTVAGTQTYSAQQGTYVRVGDLVSCFIRIVMTAKDPATSGAIVINGLPFSSDSGSRYGGSAVFSNIAINTGSNYTQLGGKMVGGNSDINLQESGNSVPASNITDVDITNSTAIEMSITYRVA